MKTFLLMTLIASVCNAAPKYHYNDLVSIKGDIEWSDVLLFHKCDQVKNWVVTNIEVLTLKGEKTYKYELEPSNYHSEHNSCLYDVHLYEEQLIPVRL